MVEQTIVLNSKKMNTVNIFCAIVRYRIQIQTGLNVYE